MTKPTNRRDPVMNHPPKPDRTRLTLGRDLIRRDPTTAGMLVEVVIGRDPGDAELVVSTDDKVRIPDSCDHRERGWAKLSRQTILDMVERGASGDELRAYMQEQIVLAEHERDQTE